MRFTYFVTHFLFKQIDTKKIFKITNEKGGGGGKAIERAIGKETQIDKIRKFKKRWRAPQIHRKREKKIKDEMEMNVQKGER